MEQPNHIDELMRQRLQHAVAPPPAAVWPRVEAALRKRRRRFLFFWFLGAGMACLGLLGWWWRSGVVEKNTWMYQTEAKDVNTDQTKPAAIAGNNPVATNQKENETLETATISQVQKGEKEAGNTAIPGMEDLKQQARTNKTSRKTEQKGVSKTQLPTEISGLAIMPAGAPTTDKDIPKPIVSDMGISSRKETPFIPTLNVPLASPLSPSHPLTSHTSLAPLTPSIVKNKKETRNCYDFAGHPNVLLIDAYLGPSLVRKEMSTGPDNQPYLAQRRNTESRDWSYSAGLRASILLDRHFLLRSGLHYDQINEKFEYFDPNYVQVTIRQTTQIVNGQPVTVIDTLGVDYGEHYLKSYNRFGMLDIPLEVGVELRNGRSGLSLNAGFAVNVLFWKRGAILSPIDGRPAYFTPGSGTVDVFRAKAGLSAMGSVQWFCHLRPKLRIFAEPTVRAVLRPVTISGHPVEQRYGMLGLNIGMTRILD